MLECTTITTEVGGLRAPLLHKAQSRESHLCPTTCQFLTFCLKMAQVFLPVYYHVVLRTYLFRLDQIRYASSVKQTAIRLVVSLRLLL